MRIETLQDRVVVNPDTHCWNWSMYRNRAGYGVVSHDGKARLAHRVVYELAIGPIPPGHDIDHLCFNPGCVNPVHLRPLLPVANRRKRRGTHCHNGHPWRPETTYLWVDQKGRTHAQCVVCRRRIGRESYQRKMKWERENTNA